MNSSYRSLGIPSSVTMNRPRPLIQSSSSVSVSSDLSSTCRFRMLNALEGSYAANARNHSETQKFEIPIVGYEVIEERAKFTVFKLHIQNTTMGDSWFVFRRYTDFVRLFGKIKNSSPELKLALPRKRWFGDNFDPRFLKERIHGLQELVNCILRSPQLCSSKVVRDFFCLDEPPSYAESVEESRAIFEALEETIYHLRTQLRTRDAEIEKLRLNLLTETKKREELLKFVTSSTKKCAECVKECQKVSVVASTAPSHRGPTDGSGDHRQQLPTSTNMPQVMQVEDVTSILAQLL